jgi:predicted amidohydrolase
MRITDVQMNCGHDKAANIVQARELINSAVAADRPRLIALPEIWSCLGGDYPTKLSQGEALPSPGSTEDAGPAFTFLQNIAREHGIYVHGGSIGERVGDRLFNTTLVFDPNGDEIARYRKIHLFDVDAPDGAGYRESEEYGPGDSLVTYEVDGIKVGCAICYDLRFPEMFLALRRAGVELIVLPAAFTLQTGKDHWEVLLRARAIETQCWFAAPGTWGSNLDRDGHVRFTYGHSLICDPWGNIVAKASDGIGWSTTHMDRSLTARIRKDMPVLAHRSPEEKELAIEG